MLPFIDLKAQQQKIRTKIDKRIKAVLDHGQYILGPEVKELEEKLAVFSNSKYVLCCSSGTDALLLALLGLNLKPGEGVIVPAFTFASSAEVMPLLGAVPIFIDVNPEDALERTNKRFIKRFQIMEKMITKKGLNFSDMKLSDMDVFWEKAKEEYYIATRNK